jgi:hypothetical protein
MEIIWDDYHAYLVDPEANRAVELVYGMYFPTYDIYIADGRDYQMLRNSRQVLQMWE